MAERKKYLELERKFGLQRDTSFPEFMKRMHDPEEGHDVSFESWLGHMSRPEFFGWVEAYKTDEAVNLMYVLNNVVEEVLGEPL